jgi:hypothetical protein
MPLPKALTHGKIDFLLIAKTNAVIAWAGWASR